MLCPQCKLKARIRERIERGRELTLVWECRNPRCLKYGQVIGEQSIPLTMRENTEDTQTAE